MTKLKVYAGKVNRRKTVPIHQDEANLDQWQDFEGNPIDTQHMMISLLLPPAVKEFLRKVDEEVKGLCGSRHEQGGDNKRWGQQEGSIVLANQKVRLKKPRIRNGATKTEVPIKIYEEFQDPSLFDEQIFQEGMKKVSQRDYTKGLPKIAASFGFTKSSVSRRWIRASEKRLEELNTRDLSQLGIVAVFIDGKRLSDRGVVIALAICGDGKKLVIGIYECNTESSGACHELLSQLERRGLPESELLFVVDGGSGLNKALEERYDVHLPEKRRAVRVRCYAHKWRNIEKTLPEEVKPQAAALFWGIRDAARLDVAEECAASLEDLLGQANESSLKSFREAREDLLNLHRLGLTPTLRKFFSTTNALESLNFLVEEDLRRVKRWTDSHHFQRWIAAACLQGEKRMRRVRGYKCLPALKSALSRVCFHEGNNNDLDEELMTGT